MAKQLLTFMLQSLLDAAAKVSSQRSLRDDSQFCVLPALLQACTQAAQKAAPGASAATAKQLLDFMLQSLLDAAAKVSS